MNVNEYKILSSKNTFNGVILNIVDDVVTLPNGKTTHREFVLRGDASAIVCIDDDTNVILINQYRHPAYDIVLEIPAGMIENDETPLQAAKRELEEETSIKAQNFKHMITMYPAIGMCSEKIHIYLATNLSQGEFNFDDDEFIEVLRVPLDDAINMIYSGKIVDSKTIASLLTCKKYLKEENC